MDLCHNCTNYGPNKGPKNGPDPWCYIMFYKDLIRELKKNTQGIEP